MCRRDQTQSFTVVLERPHYWESDPKQNRSKTKLTQQQNFNIKQMKHGWNNDDHIVV